MESYNPDGHVHRFDLLRFRSPLLAELSLFLGLLRCFSSPGSLPLGYQATHLMGFPIRTFLAITAAHASPRLLAVYHVLLRHLTPRHPPCALIRFRLSRSYEETDTRLSNLSVDLFWFVRFFISLRVTTCYYSAVKVRYACLRIFLYAIFNRYRQPSFSVEVRGLEPLTYALQRRRSPN